MSKNSEEKKVGEKDDRDEKFINSLAEEIYQIFKSKHSEYSSKYDWGRKLGAVPKFLKSASGWGAVSGISRSMDGVIQMRKVTSGLWPSLNEEQQFELIKWVVEDWGGIGRTKEQTFRDYCRWMRDISPDNKMGTGDSWEKLFSWKNISGKSKAMAFVNPENYFIYDSRVSIAINSIIVERLNWSDKFFHLAQPKGNNERYRYLKEKIDEMKKKEGVKASYQDYCRLIKTVARLMGLDVEDRQKVEMWLFVLGCEYKNIQKGSDKSKSCVCSNAEGQGGPCSSI